MSLKRSRQKFESPDSREYPLHEAVRRDDVAAARTLLETGEYVHKLDHNGNTPLFWAISYGRLRILELLLDFGANIEAEFPGGYTPLYCATWNINMECMKILLDNKANVNGNQNGVPLICAARKNWCDAAELLLKHGADVNCADEWGRTPLMNAISHESPGCVELLLKAGAELNCFSKDSKSALHFACAYGSVRTIRELVAHGANVNLTARGVASCLAVATRRGEVRLVRELLHDGAHVNQRGSNGNTALHHASYVRQSRIAEILARAGASPYMMNDCFKTPFGLCRADRNRSVIDTFLQCDKLHYASKLSGASWTALKKYEKLRTRMHYAVSQLRKSCTLVLLSLRGSALAWNVLALIALYTCSISTQEWSFDQQPGLHMAVMHSFIYPHADDSRNFETIAKIDAFEKILNEIIE